MPDVSDIHQRLDSITRQIEQISQPRPAPRPDAPRGDIPREPGVARQLNDAISRLDARLSQISNPAPRPAQIQDRQRQAEMVERAASQVYRPSPPLSPASFDFAIAEIAARPERAGCARAPVDAAAQRLRHGQRPIQLPCQLRCRWRRRSCGVASCSRCFNSARRVACSCGLNAAHAAGSGTSGGAACAESIDSGHSATQHISSRVRLIGGLS